MLKQFKCHIWLLTKYCSGAILLAAESQPRKLDKLQRDALYEHDLNNREVFIDHNFSPPLPFRKYIFVF